MKVCCVRCGETAEVDLGCVHEADRRCWGCKAPWAPDGYEGELVRGQVEVSPALAYDWLTGVPDESGHWTQAPPSRVRAYAEVMRAGAWVDAGKPICFDAHGQLVTGVLRLMACIEAETGFTSWVERFDPLVDGRVPFAGKARGMPRLLGYWHHLRANHVPQ